MGLKLLVISAFTAASLSACTKAEPAPGIVETDPATDETMYTTEREEINQFLKTWDQAMIDADTQTLGALMADDIVIRHITGATQTKEEWMAEVASGSMDYHKIVRQNVKMDFKNATRADVTSTTVITATIWGGNGTWTLNSNMHLEKRNGKWQGVN